MVLTQCIHDLGNAACKFATAQQLEWVTPCTENWGFNYYEISRGDEFDLVRGERAKRMCIVQRASSLKEQSRLLGEHGNQAEQRFAAALSTLCPAIRYLYDCETWSLDPGYKTTTRQLDIIANSDGCEQQQQELEIELIKSWADVNADLLESTRTLLSDLLDLRTIQERLTATRLSLYEHIRATTSDIQLEKRQRGTADSTDTTTRFPAQTNAILA